MRKKKKNSNFISLQVVRLNTTNISKIERRKDGDGRRGGGVEKTDEKTEKWDKPSLFFTALQIMQQHIVQAVYHYRNEMTKVRQQQLVILQRSFGGLKFK